ncbi:uncharacterized mitochondrial protein AtMg00810-like [Telopea speciosissima]|uniref:uncharacterized mitochondrial protein AtMg00810-like n=1 Tax=Telopea speciosissima TaxID=54955 RepID=UPI001CC47307|nr:uncharacterized mitochondrial protein AtMg00810-like [Telopea speciosissima]
MVIYVDDNNAFGIAEVKAYLHQHFQIKNLGALKYFLGIEVLRNKKGISLSQRKYVLNLLTDTGMLTSKPQQILLWILIRNLDPIKCPKKIQWDAAYCVLRYQKSAPGKNLFYLPNRNANLVRFSDADWASADGDKWSTSGYCTFVGGNLVSWKSKKQTTVA